jgi:hypothetical protein
MIYYYLENFWMLQLLRIFKIIIQSALAKGFDVGIQKFRDFLATLRETAVKEQEVAISQAISKQHFS